MTGESRRPTMFKDGYDGARPEGRLTRVEQAAFEAGRKALVRRLHDAMLVLAVGQDEVGLIGKGSNWPAYLHEFADKVGWDRTDAVAPARFDPTGAQLDDLLPTLALLDGLRPVYLKVLFLRALGEFFGGWSWEAIGDRYGRSVEWARQSYEAVVVQAARRSGLLEPAPAGWAVLAVSLRMGGWCSYLTTASDPRQQLYDLRSKSPVDLEEAFAFWLPGAPAAKAAVAVVRRDLEGRNIRGSWWRADPDEISARLIEAARKAGSAWRLEALELPKARRTAKGAARVTAASAATDEAA